MVVEHAPWAQARGVFPLQSLAGASSAWLTSASASAFCARGTERIDQRSKPAQRRHRLAVQRASCAACLTLYSPLTCLAIELGVVDDLDLGRAERLGALRARAAARGTPRRCSSRRRGPRIASSTTSPSGVASTAAAAAGPGLPRAPPSTWTTSFTRGAATLRVDRREARRGRAAAGDRASRAVLRRLARRAVRPRALGLAAVDDDLHVRVVLVVVREPVVELGGQLLWDHAVDHRSARL